MIEVNLIALVSVFVMLTVHTVAIVGAYFKFGNRISITEAKLDKMEKEFIPSILEQMKRENAKDSRTRQLECAAITGKEIAALRDEVRDIKAMLKEHLAVTDEREKHNNKMS